MVRSEVRDGSCATGDFARVACRGSIGGTLQSFEFVIAAVFNKNVGLTAPATRGPSASDVSDPVLNGSVEPIRGIEFSHLLETIS